MYFTVFLKVFGRSSGNKSTPLFSRTNWYVFNIYTLVEDKNLSMILESLSSYMSE